MRYHINIYHTKGPLKGQYKAIRYFEDELTARRFYRHLYRHELLGLNPTFWACDEQGRHTRISDFVALALDEYILVWDNYSGEHDVISNFEYAVFEGFNPLRYTRIGPYRAEEY